MSYEDETAQAIRPAHLTGIPAPEPQMRSFALTIFAPMLALAGLGLVTLVPSPKEIVMAMKPVGTPLQIVQGRDPDAREPLVSLASRIKDAAGHQIGANADCFEDLNLADPAKLDRCGRVVYQALAEVEENPRAFSIGTAAPISRKALVEELRLAATEVCRERWSRAGIVPEASPACAVSLAALETPRD